MNKVRTKRSSVVCCEREHDPRNEQSEDEVSSAIIRSIICEVVSERGELEETRCDVSNRM